MRPKSIVLLLLALGCGLVASIGINQVLATNRAKPPEPKGETKSILVAMADINLRGEISPQNVRLEAWPVELVPGGALISFDDVNERRSRTLIVKGEPILDSKLLSKDAGRSVSGLIPKGFRSVSVRVDSVSGSSSLILPDDRVDVLVHIRANQSQNINQTVTRTILQDVRVFAVNDQVGQNDELSDEQSIAAKTVSLLLSPEETELVALASEIGKLRLVMRSPEDDVASETDGAEIGELLSDGPNERDGDDTSLVYDDNSGDNLLNLLNGEPQTVIEPEPVFETAQVPDDVWTMVLVIGSEAREVQFGSGSRLPKELNSLGSDSDADAIDEVEDGMSDDIDIEEEDFDDDGWQDADDDGSVDFSSDK